MIITWRRSCMLIYFYCGMMLTGVKFRGIFLTQKGKLHWTDFYCDSCVEIKRVIAYSRSFWYITDMHNQTQLYQTVKKLLWISSTKVTPFKITVDKPGYHASNLDTDFGISIQIPSSYSNSNRFIEHIHPCSKVIAFFSMSINGNYFQCIDLNLFVLHDEVFCI